MDSLVTKSARLELTRTVVGPQHIKPFASSPYSCLLGAPIPYSDDYQDLDLPDFTTISGYGPDEEQSAAMDAFVHSLDLMTAEKDEDGGWDFLFRIDTTLHLL